MALNLENHRIIRNRNNTFALVNGIEAIELEPGYCKAKLDITENHFNPLDTVHGGCIFTLADVAASFVACSHGIWHTTLDCNMQFLRAASKTKTLFAEARELKKGKKVTVIEVEVKDQDDKLIAKCTTSFMSLGEEIPDYDDLNADFVVKKYNTEGTK